MVSKERVDRCRQKIASLFLPFSSDENWQDQVYDGEDENKTSVYCTLKRIRYLGKAPNNILRRYGRAGDNRQNLYILAAWLRR
jgi:hypothetical protein